MDIFYHLFLRIEVTHSYFPEGVNDLLRLEPFQEATSRLKDYNIYVRHEENRFDFYCGTADSSHFDMTSALDGLNTVKFTWMPLDQLFYNYTANTDHSNEMLVTENRADSNHLSITNSARIRDLPEPAIGILNLDFSLLNVKPENNRLKLHFESREVYWQYFIVVPENLNLTIQKMELLAQHETLFNGPSASGNIGNQKAMVFTSRKAIPLVHRTDNLPTLKLTTSNSPNGQQDTIELKLPNMNSENIKIITIENKEVLSASAIIYV